MSRLVLSPAFFLSSFLTFGRSTPCSLVWWLLCLQWSVDPPLARQSGCQELLSQSLFHVCAFYRLSYSTFHLREQSGGRYEKEYFSLVKYVSLWP